MIARIEKSGLLLPSVLMMLGLAVLLSLGTWQLNRKAWKDALIAKLTERVAEAPVQLRDARARWSATGDVEYLRVTATGRFEHDKERYLYAPHPQRGPGSHVYTPLRVGPQEVVWINRGWVPERLKTFASRKSEQPMGEVTITGVVRLSGVQGTFDPGNDRAGNQWFWRDLEGMHASAFAAPVTRAFPFFIDADANQGHGARYPQGGVTRLKLPNRHLEYAITWYGLGVVLLAVFFVFARGRLGQTS